jgi:hypothetical protein
MNLPLVDRSFDVVAEVYFVLRVSLVLGGNMQSALALQAGKKEKKRRKRKKIAPIRSQST